MTDVEIANIAGAVTFNQELALDALAETFESRDEVLRVTYNPAENHWLQTWFAPDETYVAFYRSGRCSIVGCDTMEDFDAVVERVVVLMRELLGFSEDPDVAVTNLVATADAGVAIQLEPLVVELGFEATEYEPEQFPAVIYRQLVYVVLIFSSGRLLCTGLTDVDEITEAIQDVKERIQSVH